MKLQRQIDTLLAQRASEWHQILQGATESQRAEFVAWLKQSPLHVQEYLETAYTDQVLQHIDPERVEDVEGLIAQSVPSVVPLPGISATPRSRSSRPVRWAIVFASAAMALLCLALLPIGLQHVPTTGPEYATTIGEQREIQLADNSIVTLNADSRIHVHLSKSSRDIKLVHGEALFKVAHDPNRPFTVHARTAVVVAVGTQFNVYERPDGIRVSVLEGRVKITSQSDGTGVPKGARIAESLGAGEEAQVTLDGSIQRNAQADVMRTVAWRERRLIFEDASIEEMIYEFNRYNRVPRLRLEGVPRGSHHYSGIFDAADPDSLADVLSRESDLSVERINGEIIIRKRE